MKKLRVAFGEYLFARNYPDEAGFYLLAAQDF